MQEPSVLWLKKKYKVDCTNVSEPSILGQDVKNLLKI